MRAGIMPTCSDYWEFKCVCPVTWSAMLARDFTLQYTTNPADPGSWQAFPSTPVSFGAAWSGIADWADGTGKFYRLKKP